MPTVKELVDQIIAGATEVGATFLKAEFPRSYIDPNRAENDIDPVLLSAPWPDPLNPEEITLYGLGLIRRLTNMRFPIYERPLSIAEAKARIENYYRPYHKAVEETLISFSEKFGTAVLLDFHSTPSRLTNGKRIPDFVLGDRDGCSCEPALIDLVKEIILSLGYGVAINNPYKGREIMTRYGKPERGWQALQIELNRDLYLDEARIEKKQGFSRLCTDMTRFFELLAPAFKEIASTP